MNKYIFVVLLLFGCAAANSQTTVQNSSVAVKDGDDRAARFEFQPWYRLDTITGETRVQNYGAWWLIHPSSARPILRLPEVGDTVTYFDWYYFAPPTITSALSPTTTIYEVGTSNAITISGATSNPAGTTLTAGTLGRTAPAPTTEILGFTSATTYSQAITFTPQQAGSGNYNELVYSFRASQDYTGAESGTATSPTRTVTAVYPVLYGVSATDLTATGDPYTALTKLVQAEGNKAVNMNGSGFIYYAVPSTWTDVNLSAIFDGNGFNVTPSFTSSTVSVTSSGLTNNWTLNYTIYKLNTSTTVSNATYTFNR